MHRIDKITIIYFVMFMISIVFFIYRNIVGFGFIQFGDEAGHFLGAIAIHNQDLLYRDYIDAHGPLIFLVTWLLGKCVGFTHIWLLRLVSTLFISIVGLLIFNCSIFINIRQCILATALWFFSIASVWTVQGLYLNSYWTLGGALTTIALVTIIFPILYQSSIKKIYAFIGGVAIGLLPATAYTFSLVSVIFYIVILYISIFKNRNYLFVLYLSLIGCCLANLLVFGWLLVYGDIKGMIIYHFFVNQFYYIHYSPFIMKYFLESFIPTLKPDYFVHDLAIYSFFIGGIIVFLSSKYKVSVFLILLAILTLQLRGDGLFHDGAFLIVSFGMFSLAFIRKIENKPVLCVFLTFIIIIVCILHGKYAVATPFEITYQDRKKVEWRLLKEEPNLDDIKLIQKYAKPNQRILVIPYNPIMYIYANRLPIKKYHAYLPWEADYAKHPWNGYDRDICKDLPIEKPPVIVYYDNAVIWRKYPVQKYMPCVSDFVKKEYIQMPAYYFIYVRKDLIDSK